MTESKKNEKRQAREQRLAARNEKRQKSFLNKIFHHVDLGSTTGREIMGGLLACILCVCAIFMNVQLISGLLVSGPAASAGTADIAANGEIIARQYFLSMLAAFAGSLLIGLLARLPLVQIPSLGLSSLMISALGIGTGLSCQNLLAVCFVASVVYAVIGAVPVIRRAVLNAIPRSVRRAAPAALGVLVVFAAMQLTGLVSPGASPIRDYGVGASVTRMEGLSQTTQTFSLFDFKTYNNLGFKADSFYPLIQICLICAVAAFAAYLLFRKTKRPVMHSLMLSTLLYFVLLVLLVVIEQKRGKLNFNLDPLWGRLWMVGSEDAQHLHLSAIFRSLNLGEVFTAGFDFTAYRESGGNVLLLFVTGSLTFLFSSLAATDAMTGDAGEKQAGMVMEVNAGMNVIAPVLGIAPLSVTPLNQAQKRDGARSGLCSLVASLGFLASAFVWVVPFLFSTTSSYDIQFNLYGHYGTSMQLFTESSFIVADAVMAITGLCLIAEALRCGFENGRESAVFFTTVLVTFFLQNLALGFAAGMIAHLLVNALDRERELSLGNILAAVCSLGYVVLTLL